MTMIHDKILILRAYRNYIFIETIVDAKYQRIINYLIESMYETVFKIIMTKSSFHRFRIFQKLPMRIFKHIVFVCSLQDRQDFCSFFATKLLS